MVKYEDYDWKELPDDAKDAAKVLGYNKKMWNNNGEPECCDEYWDDLTNEQQEAATVLGYDKKSWDNEGLASCCVIC